MRAGVSSTAAALAIVAALGACGGGQEGGSPSLTLSMATPGGDAQTDTIGATLSQQVRVVVEGGGSGVEGEVVQWAVTSGGGQITSATSVTGVDGVAAMTWRLGNAVGQQTARATVPEAAGSPITFTATALPGRPATIEVTAGDGQVAFVNSPFAVAPEVLVKDRAGNPRPSTVVAWTVEGGSLVLDAGISQTSAQGLASIPVQAGPTPGPATLTATAQGGINVTTQFDLSVINIDRQVTVGPGSAFTSDRNGSSNPAVDTVQAGQTVRWMNAGGTHSVRAIPPSAFPGSADLAQGQSHFVTFNTPGTFPYICGVHGNAETGTIVVE
jgi:hypothetical protein